jgi:ribosomal protein S27E
MSFQGLCPKCRILLFDVNSIAGFGENREINCRSCGRTYLVAEQGGKVVFKRDTWKKYKKAALS